MEKIKVTLLVDEDNDDYVCEVEVLSDKYKVTLPNEYYKQLTGGKVSAEELVRRSFEFLLEREGPESILPEFDLPTIQRYFPEYESTILAQ